MGPPFAIVIQRYNVEQMPLKARGTQVAQASHIMHWLKVFGCRRVGSITSQDVVLQREALSKRHGRRTQKPLSRQTVRHYLTTLSHIFEVCCREWGYCDSNPCAHVKKPPASSGRVRFLSAEERTRLLAECRNSTNELLYCAVLISLISGLRAGELRAKYANADGTRNGLRWRDIDFDARHLDLPKTKNGKPRRVPISKSAVEELRRVYARRQEWALRRGRNVQPDDLVFTDTFLHFFPEAVRRAGIKDFHFHDLRHSAASELVMNGADLVTVAAILGHSSMQMVKRYAHLDTRHLSAAIDGVAARIGA